MRHGAIVGLHPGLVRVDGISAHLAGSCDGLHAVTIRVRDKRPVRCSSAAVASFGALVAPGGALAPPLVGLVLAVAGVLFIFRSNAPGLADGIEPESWALATLIGGAAAYAVGAAAFGVRRTRKSPPV